MKLGKFKSQYKQCILNINGLEEKSKSIAKMRSIAALLFFITLYFGYKYYVAGYGLSLLAFLMFFVLVRRHQRVNEAKNYQEALKKVLSTYINRFDDSWRDFADTGEDFISADFPQSIDLNVLGKDSLFQYINTARTAIGRKLLTGRLMRFIPQKADIEQNQRAVKELLAREDFIIKFQCLLNLFDYENQRKGSSVEKFLTEMESNRIGISQVMDVLKNVLPVITILSIIFAFLSPSPSVRIAPACLMLLQLALSGFTYNITQEKLKGLQGYYSEIETYQQILLHISQQEFKSDYLKELQKSLLGKHDAIKALQELGGIGEAVKARYNGVFFIVFNGLLLWDWHCVAYFKKWMDKYAFHVRDWLTVIGEFEALISLTVISHVKDEYTFPVIKEQIDPLLEFTDLKHPLIHSESVVGNNFAGGSGTHIITGSNMSGKTTFLRTIGINLVLAYAGAPVLAQEFCVSAMALFTSINIQDSVNDGISTFYAELLRIKAIVEFDSSNCGMIALIDEIFKGTNSQDRIIGAIETIKRISNKHTLVFITTHDFELCSIETEHGLVSNYYFSEYYVNNKIEFDYKIRPGKCRTTNAKFLLQMVGIIE
ncbi:MAG: MutS-related protein [Bacillota bacterium]